LGKKKKKFRPKPSVRGPAPARLGPRALGVGPPHLLLTPLNQPRSTRLSRSHVERTSASLAPGNVRGTGHVWGNPENSKSFPRRPGSRTPRALGVGPPHLLLTPLNQPRSTRLSRSHVERTSAWRVIFMRPPKLLKASQNVWRKSICATGRRKWRAEALSAKGKEKWQADAVSGGRGGSKIDFFSRKKFLAYCTHKPCPACEKKFFLKKSHPFAIWRRKHEER
jgi:hypothetical protein